METVHYCYPKQTSHFQNESRKTSHLTPKTNNPKETNTKTDHTATKTIKYQKFHNKSRD